MKAKDRIPVSLQQERLLVLQALNPQANLNIAVLLTFPAPIEASIITAAIETIVAAQSALRTSIRFVDRDYAQIVHDRDALRMPVTTVSDDADESVRRRASALAKEPIDIGHAPLFRVVLFGDPARHLLLIVHHLIADGWSVGLFVDQLLASMRGDGQGEDQRAQLSSYGDFAVRQRGAADDAVLAAQREYWQRHLAGASVSLELPTDYAAADMAFKGETVAVDVPHAVHMAATDLAAGLGVSLFMTMHAAICTVLSRIANNDDLLILIPWAGRTKPEFYSTIGCFVDLLALRTDLSNNPTFHELVRRVSDACFDAYDHADLPIERALRCVGDRDPRGRPAAPRVFVNMLSFPFSAARRDGVCAWLIQDTNVGRRPDLNFYVHDYQDQLALGLLFNAALFTTERARGLLNQVLEVLAQVTREPDRPIGDLSFGVVAVGR